MAYDDPKRYTICLNSMACHYTLLPSYLPFFLRMNITFTLTFLKRSKYTSYSHHATQRLRLNHQITLSFFSMEFFLQKNCKLYLTWVSESFIFIYHHQFTFHFFLYAAVSVSNVDESTLSPRPKRPTWLAYPPNKKKEDTISQFTTHNLLI